MVDRGFALVRNFAFPFNIIHPPASDSIPPKCLDKFKLNNKSVGPKARTREQFPRLVFLKRPRRCCVKKTPRALRKKKPTNKCYKTSFSHSLSPQKINNLWDNEAENIDFLLIMEQNVYFFIFTSSCVQCQSQVNIYIQRVHNSKTCMFGSFWAATRRLWV